MGDHDTDGVSLSTRPRLAARRSGSPERAGSTWAGAAGTTFVFGAQIRSAPARVQSVVMIGRVGLALAAVALLAACSGDSDGAEGVAVATTAPPPATQPTEPAEPAAPDPTAPPATAPDPQELEDVVRAWSAALNAGDNDAAAALFAPGAFIFQAGVGIPLRTRQEAVLWNSGLPCSGEIVELSVDGEIVTAVFSLGHRPASRCDAAPGTLAAAQFVIREGRIVLWRQIPPPAPESETETSSGFETA